MTSEVKPGPPRVIAQIRSNERSPPISDSRMTVTVAGRASGRMIRRKLSQALAPSILAASKYSAGMDTMPAI
jgi:hypothetical protein